jgi:hypothetical protein
VARLLNWYPLDGEVDDATPSLIVSHLAGMGIILQLLQRLETIVFCCATYSFGSGPSLAQSRSSSAFASQAAKSATAASYRSCCSSSSRRRSYLRNPCCSSSTRCRLSSTLCA